MCTSWSSANQISNFKFSAFFRVLFALWSLKYPHPKSQQTPGVSTELEMVVKLSYSFIPLQEVSQKGVDRSVENPQKRTEDAKMAPNAPNKFSWRMPLCFSTHDWLKESNVIAEIVPYMAPKKIKYFSGIRVLSLLPVARSQMTNQTCDFCNTFHSFRGHPLGFDE